MASAQELLPTPQAITRTRQFAPVNVRLNVKSTDFPVQTKAFRQDWSVASAAGAPQLTLKRDPSLPEEGYRIEFGGAIEVRASTPTGAAWGLQTLGQLLASGTKSAVVTDAPDTPFRCVMIDVARRYHSISTLKRLVRWAALGKVRFIQLHLTDDQNWMLPSTVVPGIDKLNSHQRPAYTRAELEELQAFATARGVTLIPEVEFPGHAAILCQYDPAKFRLAGSASENCINFGSEAVRKTCRDILAETAAIFKDSPYIHFGGDEAWYPDADKDPQFRAAMDRLGPGADANRVFIDFVGDMAQEVVKLGKTPLVWEGFPRSDFAKQRIPSETVVIAWENHYYPATHLVEDGFKVINAGWDPYYVVNHYPWDAYTLVPLARLYNHDPDVFGIVAWNDLEQSAAKIGPGLYGSLMPWWEGHEWNTLAVMPERILAFGCRLWNREGESGYLGFRRRARHWLTSVDRVSHPFEVHLEGVRSQNPEQFTDFVHVRATPAPGLEIRMSTDERVPTIFDGGREARLEFSGIVTIQAFRGGEPVGEAALLRLNKVTEVPNLARGAKAWSSAHTDPQFAADLVTDGVADDIGSFWMCYPLPADLKVDLGRAVEARRVEIVAFYAAGSALQYRVQVSTDGLTWEEVADASANSTGATAEGYVHRFSPRPVRYVRVQDLRSLQHPSTMPRIHEIRLFND
ncbi:MAG TPA: family 20 glycosylhydrolase [Fimbriimonadaceae bacterium]|nr:family 20 glycosylhydrolase [Fimbriimonadaceae bacterium]